MKTVEPDATHLDVCAVEARAEPGLLTRDGEAVPGLVGLDDEQERLGRSERFWTLVAERRRQPKISRAELERHLASPRSRVRG